MIVRQPDGKYAWWSSVVDDWTHVDMSVEDVEDVMVATAVREAFALAKRSIEKAVARPDDDERSFSELERWRKKVHGAK